MSRRANRQGQFRFRRTPWKAGAATLGRSQIAQHGQCHPKRGNLPLTGLFQSMPTSRRQSISICIATIRDKAPHHGTLSGGKTGHRVARECAARAGSADRCLCGKGGAAIEDVLGSIGDICPECRPDAGYPQSLSGSADGANGEQVPSETSSKEISLERGRNFRGDPMSPYWPPNREYVKIEGTLLGHAAYLTCGSIFDGFTSFRAPKLCCLCRN
jgi:hypothetical protein